MNTYEESVESVREAIHAVCEEKSLTFKKGQRMGVFLRGGLPVCGEELRRLGLHRVVAKTRTLVEGEPLVRYL